MIRNLDPDFLPGLLAAAAASVLIGNSKSKMDGRRCMAYAVAVRGIPAYVCEGRDPPHGGTRHDGRGNWSAFTFMQASVGTCLPDSNDAAKTDRPKIDGGLPCVLVGVFGSERNPRGMDSVVEFQSIRERNRPPARKPSPSTAPAKKSAAL